MHLFFILKCNAKGIVFSNIKMSPPLRKFQKFHKKLRNENCQDFLSLSLLTWPTCIYIVPYVGRFNSLPGAEARGTSGPVPSRLCSTLYLHPDQPPLKRLQFFYHISISQSYAPTLLSLSLRLRFSPPPSPPVPPHISAPP